MTKNLVPNDLILISQHLFPFWGAKVRSLKKIFFSRENAVPHSIEKTGQKLFLSSSIRRWFFRQQKHRN